MGSVGLEEEGIYKKPGVLSKAATLMKDCIGVYISTLSLCLFVKLTISEGGKLSKIKLDDAIEYDTKTITSAMKMYFRLIKKPYGNFLNVAFPSFLQ